MPVFENALPDGMHSATVSLGPARVFEQAGAGMEITAMMLGTVPVNPLTKKAPRLSWGPDSSGWYDVASGGKVDAGAEISFIVPCTNQTGWKWDGIAVTDGHALSITITLSARINGRTVESLFGPFVIDDSQDGTTVDLDDLIDMTTDMGQTIKVTDQWSAFMAACEAAAAAAAASLAAFENPTITDTVYDGSLNLTSWTENDVACSATYNGDNTIHTLTTGTTTRTFTYNPDGTLEEVA